LCNAKKPSPGRPRKYALAVHKGKSKQKATRKKSKVEDNLPYEKVFANVDVVEALLEHGLAGFAEKAHLEKVCLALKWMAR